MGAPSQLHEERVAILDAIAVLAGFPAPARLVMGGLPDVLRVDPVGLGLFIGDGKETEVPSCRETQVRLRGYVSQLSRWSDLDRRGLLALCIPGMSPVTAWMEMLCRIAEEERFPARSDGVATLSSDHCLVWVTNLSSSPSIS